MEANRTNDSITESITVNAPRERAFYAFAQQMTSWWPREYTWSEHRLGHIVLDPEVGSRWYEKDGNGVEQPDWGKLLVWEPPDRLVLSWMVGTQRRPETDPTHGSEVEVRFSDAPDGRTLVELEHRGFSHHGEGWEAYRQGMGGSEGWSKILAAYAAYVGEQQKYGAVA